MNPKEIVQRAGDQKTRELFLELNGPLMREVVKHAGLSWKPRGSRHLTPSRKRALLAERLHAAITAEDQDVDAAAALIEAWLRARRQPMLDAYLTSLNVDHSGGFTEQAFMSEIEPQRLLDAAARLCESFSRADVAIYVHYLDHDFKTEVFASEEQWVSALTGSGS